VFWFLGLVSSVLATATCIVFGASALYLKRCLCVLKEPPAVEKEKELEYQQAFINQINLLNTISSYLLPLGTTLLIMFFSTGILLQFAVTDLKVLTALLGGFVFIIFFVTICYTLIGTRKDRSTLGSLQAFTHDADLVLPISPVVLRPVVPRPVVLRNV